MSADKPIKAPKIVVRKCADLTPDFQNPRTPISGHAKESLRRSLERFGMVDPILTDGPLLVGGHQRLVVWTELGHDTVPTIDVGPLEPAERRALNVALNKIESDWDYGKLSDTLRELREASADLFVLTGFSSRDLDNLLGSTGEPTLEDFSVEPSQGKAWLVVQGSTVAVARLAEILKREGYGGARVESRTEGVPV